MIITTSQSDDTRRDYLNQEAYSKTPAETQDEVEGALLLDVVIRERAPVLELLASEDKTLLVRGDTLLVLNLGLHVVDRVGRLNLKRDCLASQRLHEDLHTTTQTEHEMESGLLLDVVVREGAAVLKLLASKDQTLLVRWDAIGDKLNWTPLCTG